MEHKIWFKPKKYGWGWTPVSPEGWQVIILYVLFLLVDFLRLDSPAHSVQTTLSPFIMHMILASIVLVAISYWKGERRTGK